MSGLPPYGPGDLIDVEVDEDEHVWITMADHFSRPLRLTRQEALAITLRSAELLATPGLPEAPALAGAVRKLREALGPDTVGTDDAIATADAGPPSGASQGAATGGQGPRTHHDRVLRGLDGRVDHARRRARGGLLRDGQLVRRGLGRRADDERLFRADRIRCVTPAGIAFEPRGLEGAGRALYTPTGDEVPVRLRCGRVLRWIAEYYATGDAA